MERPRDGQCCSLGWIRPWMQLVKAPLCLPVAGSAAFGYLLQLPSLSPALAALCAGVFSLACGAAAGNSLQERATDGMFNRTRHRPLVTGRLGVDQALWCSVVLAAAGLLLLGFAAETWQPLLLGIAALVLYNLVYTPLKKISVSALVPGGMAGAIPPLIGWTAAGGQLADSGALHLAALFLLWQVPHFGMVLLQHREEYRSVRQPSLIGLLPDRSLRRIAAVWILAFNLVALSLCLQRDLLGPGARLVIGLMTFVMAALCLPLLRSSAPDYRRLFLLFNGLFFSTLALAACLQLLAV